MHGNTKNRTGEVSIMNIGLRAEIISYNGANSITIQFENGAIVSNKTYNNFKKGNIKCPLLINQINDYAEVTNPNLSPHLVWFMDFEDVPLLGSYLWVDNGTGYIVRSTHPGNIKLHRLVLNAPADRDVDHVNGNTFDVRKRNLRLCTESENLRNRGATKVNTSGFKGVSWHKATNKWAAYITVHQRRFHLGLYSDPLSAARAYNTAAIRHHGEFARLNDL